MVKKYQCGDRDCTESELDMIEKLRSGDATMLDKDQLAALTDVGAHIEAAVAKAAPAQALSSETITQAVSDAIAEHPIQLVDTHSYEEHLRTCPECQALEEQRFQKQLEGSLPEIAERYGYTLKSAAPDTKVKAEVIEEGKPAAAEKPQAAQAAAEPTPAPAPEPAKDETPEEEEEGITGTLHRIYKEK